MLFVVCYILSCLLFVQSFMLRLNTCLSWGIDRRDHDCVGEVRTILIVLCICHPFGLTAPVEVNRSQL